MKVEIEIFTLEEQTPKQDERVMVWNEKFREWHGQVYNPECECWDTDDGDDYERDLNPKDRWFSLPK